MDQRYDPAFQRGHAGERTRPVAVDSGRRGSLASLEEIAPQLVDTSTDSTPLAPPVDDRFDDGPRARTRLDHAQSAGNSAAPVGAGSPDGRDLDAEHLAELDEQLTFHRSSAARWERALWTVGIVLAVGGAFATWQAMTSSFRGWSSSDGPEAGYLVMQTIYAIAPGCVTVGLATIVGLLFSRMLRHDRRSRP